MEPDLCAELERAVSGVNAAGHHQVLAAAGLPQSIVLERVVGVSKIQCEGEFYQLCHDGKWAVIQPILEYEALPPNLDDKGHLLPEPWPEPEQFLVDLVAWLPKQPDRWWLRRGEPALVLGMANLDHAALAQEPLKLFRTPLGWLRGGCEGACVINARGLRPAFLGVPSVHCEGIEHGQDFDRWLRAMDRAPVWPAVQVPDERAAA